jgi:hypothetical protein
MRVKTIFAVLLFAAVLATAQEKKENESTMVSVVGYLRDAGCVHRSPQVVKPLPNGCLEACVRAGSPLVLLTKDEKVYHPISSKIPGVDIRAELLPYAGKLVKITGHTFDRGGSKAIAVEHIEVVND